MKVRVLLFAGLKELLGRESLELDSPEIFTVGDVCKILKTRYPGFGSFSRSLLVAVNQEFADFQSPIQEGDELALFPPVSGGQESTNSIYRPNGVGDIYQIVHEPIRTEDIVTQLGRSGDGAVATFLGCVRDNTQGRKTTHLLYEAYKPMALRKMLEIGEAVRRQWEVGHVGIIHRLGRLEIGEVSVAIVVTSPHRRVAFESCQYVIDTLKRTVPIWKKEFFQDGEVWVEGEFHDTES